MGLGIWTEVLRGLGPGTFCAEAPASFRWWPGLPTAASTTALVLSGPSLLADCLCCPVPHTLQPEVNPQCATCIRHNPARLGRKCADWLCQMLMC